MLSSQKREKFGDKRARKRHHLGFRLGRVIATDIPDKVDVIREYSRRQNCRASPTPSAWLATPLYFSQWKHKDRREGGFTLDEMALHQKTTMTIESENISNKQGENAAVSITPHPSRAGRTYVLYTYV